MIAIGVNYVYWNKKRFLSWQLSTMKTSQYWILKMQLIGMGNMYVDIQYVLDVMQLFNMN